MSHPEPSGPDLDGVVADANAVGLPYVVIGGFSVIANGFVCATKGSDLLVPDGQETDAAILRFLDRIEATRLRDDKVLGKTRSSMPITLQWRAADRPDSRARRRGLLTYPLCGRRITRSSDRSFAMLAMIWASRRLNWQSAQVSLRRR